MGRTFGGSSGIPWPGKNALWNKGEKGQVIAPALRQVWKVQCKSEALLEGRNGVRESFPWGNRWAVPAGVRLRPASMLEGSQLYGKETSSPKPESGQRWTPFGKVTLVPEDRETQGVLAPSSVLSADVCLSTCFSTLFRVCITAGIVSCLVVLWCVVVYFLL